MSDIKRINVGKRMSDVAIHNGVVYLAGQVADDTSKDVKGQTAQVLATIDRLLADAGSDKTRMLQVQIFLSDIANFPAMNEVWDAWVPQGHTPPRATIESRLATPAYLVEIKVIAAVR
ncbi:MAG: RidA family protein [Betaproteobacteria bacterium]|nr:RidA family protein [Betaproteobacteria bacterium]